MSVDEGALSAADVEQALRESMLETILGDIPAEFSAAVIIGIPLCTQAEMVNAAEMTARAVKFNIKDGYMRKTVNMPKGADILGVTLSPRFGGVPEEGVYQLSLLVCGGDNSDIVPTVFEIRGLRDGDYSESSRKAVWQRNATLKGGSLSVHGGFLTVGLVEEE